MKILLANVAALTTETSIFLHARDGTSAPATAAAAADGDTETVFWHFRDQMAFENISVCRPVAGASGTWKYLSCAGCEREPLGVMFLPTHTDKDTAGRIFLAHRRLAYD